MPEVKSHKERLEPFVNGLLVGIGIIGGIYYYAFVNLPLANRPALAMFAGPLGIMVLIFGVFFELYRQVMLRKK